MDALCNTKEKVTASVKALRTLLSASSEKHSELKKRVMVDHLSVAQDVPSTTSYAKQVYVVASCTLLT